MYNIFYPRVNRVCTKEMRIQKYIDSYLWIIFPKRVDSFLALFILKKTNILSQLYVDFYL